MTNLIDLTACDALELLRAGKISATELVRACLDRIALQEPVIGAWAYLNPDHALAAARACDTHVRTHVPTRPLHGLPLGVKDVLETADMPTAYGSPIYKGWRPRADCAAVAIARKAGAIVMGKTVSTEFACGLSARTANGLNPDHTSGGSSAGSCAAVANHMVPFAFGTQSASSTIRQASYNGLIGMRPSMGLISIAGFKYSNGSFDTIGLVAREVDDVELLWCSQLGVPFTRGRLPLSKLKIAVCRPSWLDRADAAASAAIDAAMRGLTDAGVEIVRLALPAYYDDLVSLHQDIQAFEAARSYAWEYETYPDMLDRRVRGTIEHGFRIPFDRYVAMMRQARAARETFGELIGDADAILTAAAPGEAPFGYSKLGAAFDEMGDTTQSRAWTLLHVPVVTVPAIRGPNNMPVGVQLIGRFGDDQKILHISRLARDAIGDPVGAAGTVA
jgi:Asp-tRNA(Asn)/Glu-tRNA(Gln) amidotransferase A subunit family amidase